MKENGKWFIGLIITAFFYYAGFIGLIYDYIAGPFFLALAFSSTVILIILFGLKYVKKNSVEENHSSTQKVRQKRWKLKDPE